MPPFVSLICHPYFGEMTKKVSGSDAPTSTAGGAGACNGSAASCATCGICEQPIIDGKDQALFCEGTCKQWIHHLRFMLFLECLKDKFSDHCSSSFTLTVLLACRSLLRQISHSMLTTSYFTNRSETMMILHLSIFQTIPNVNLWLSQGK